MLPRLFPLLACVSILGCGQGNPDGSSGSSSSGDAPIPPPKPVVWTPTATMAAPSPRYGHTAVWTGSKMIIWGGYVGGMPSQTNTGATYDPTTDTWMPTNTVNPPAARFGHVAVWTGTKMLVWGGFGNTNLEPAGGIYDPATDSWSVMSQTNQPKLRTRAKAVWTGKKMVIWGGIAGQTTEATGGIYDPEKDSWEAVNSAGAPSPRHGQGMSWSGKIMMVWGGTNFADWLNSGALFDPEGAPQGVWTTTTSTTGAPGVREQPAFDFVHSWFVAWGGWNGGPTLNDGAIFDPAKNEWLATTNTGVPAARMNHVGIAAGEHLLVWGGCAQSLCTAADLLADGGQFVPDTKGGTWYPIDKQDALAARYSATIVYTGAGVIIWGGRLDPQTTTNTGAFAPL